MKVILVLLAFVVLGCSSLGPKFDSVQAAPKGKAKVYVYRPSLFTGAARSPDIVVNGHKVGTAANGSYFTFEIDPGPIQALQRNFAGEETGEFQATLAPGAVYFLRVDLSTPTLVERVDFRGRSSGQLCPFMGLNMTVQNVDPKLIYAMDQRAQSKTCWPGFMFVSEEFARKELVETKLSR